jgi:hypothetical protein
MWKRVLHNIDPRKAILLKLQESQSQVTVVVHERDTYLKQRDEALGERNELLKQRDEALGERNELLKQRDEALGERNELLRQRDAVTREQDELHQRYGALSSNFAEVQRKHGEMVGERNEYLRQRDVALGERNETQHRLDVALGERNELLRQRDVALGERNETQHQLDVALDERNELLRQRDVALGERNETRDQLDVALGERNELLRQRDVALGERNEFQRQLGIAVGERNEIKWQRDGLLYENDLRLERLAQLLHRADVAARRGKRGGEPKRSSAFPLAATRDCALLFLQLAHSGEATLLAILTRNFIPGHGLVLEQTHLNQSVLGTWSNLDVERAIGKLRPSQLSDIRFVAGYFSPGVHKALPKPCARLALLPDPTSTPTRAGIDNYVTRVLSGNPTLNPMAPGATLENGPRPGDDDFQRAAAQLDGFLAVGLRDRFDEFLLVLANRLCWALSDMVYKEMPSSKGDQVVPNVLDRLGALNTYDRALVDRARHRLDNDIETYVGDFQADLAVFRRLLELFSQGASLDELRRIELSSLGLG